MVIIAFFGFCLIEIDVELSALSNETNPNLSRLEDHEVSAKYRAESISSLSDPKRSTIDLNLLPKDSALNSASNHI